MRKIVAAGALALGLVSLPTAAQAHAHSLWLVGIRSSSTQVVAGQRLVFTGTVHPKGAAAGEKVVLQERFKPGKPWVDQRKATIGRSGKYTVTDRPRTSFVHRYRVVMAATSRHGRGVSPTVTVKVYGWTNLDSHQYTNPNFMAYGPVDINGKTFKHSITADVEDSASLEYNLDHRCIKLRSTFGLSDDSTTGGQAEVDLEADGTNVYSHTFDLGQSQARTVALDSPLKIRLSEHNTSTTSGVFGLGTFATAQVLCIK